MDDDTRPGNVVLSILGDLELSFDGDDLVIRWEPLPGEQTRRIWCSNHGRDGKDMWMKYVYRGPGPSYTYYSADKEARFHRPHPGKYYVRVKPDCADSFFPAVIITRPPKT